MSDFDKELVLEILSQIKKSAWTILKRFEPIQSAEDFTGSEAGLKSWMPSACN